MPAKILIVDDEKVIRESLELFLREEGYKAESAADGEEAINKIKASDYDVVITDLKMPKLDGIELMKKAGEISPETFFVIMTAYASVNTAIDSLRLGAYDYLIKPVEFDDVLIRLKRLITYKRLNNENRSLRQRLATDTGYQNIIGKSEPMKRVFELIERVAVTNSNVLIIGKSGTGKELVAKAIHF
jgi:two-component system response regulator PilR (NtrC family)